MPKNSPLTAAIDAIYAKISKISKQLNQLESLKDTDVLRKITEFEEKISILRAEEHELKSEELEELAAQFQTFLLEVLVKVKEENKEALEKIIKEAGESFKKIIEEYEKRQKAADEARKQAGEQAKALAAYNDLQIQHDAQQKKVEGIREEIKAIKGKIADIDKSNEEIHKENAELDEKIRAGLEDNIRAINEIEKKYNLPLSLLDPKAEQRIYKYTVGKNITPDSVGTVAAEFAKKEYETYNENNKLGLSAQDESKLKNEYTAEWEKTFIGQYISAIKKVANNEKEVINNQNKSELGEQLSEQEKLEEIEAAKLKEMHDGLVSMKVKLGLEQLGATVMSAVDSVVSTVTPLDASKDAVETEPKKNELDSESVELDTEVTDITTPSGTPSLEKHGEMLQDPKDPKPPTVEEIEKEMEALSDAISNNIAVTSMKLESHLKGKNKDFKISTEVLQKAMADYVNTAMADLSEYTVATHTAFNEELFTQFKQQNPNYFITEGKEDGEKVAAIEGIIATSTKQLFVDLTRLHELQVKAEELENSSEQHTAEEIAQEEREIESLEEEAGDAGDKDQRHESVVSNPAKGGQSEVDSSKKDSEVAKPSATISGSTAAPTATDPKTSTAPNNIPDKEQKYELSSRTQTMLRAAALFGCPAAAPSITANATNAATAKEELKAKFGEVVANLNQAIERSAANCLDSPYENNQEEAFTANNLLLARLADQLPIPSGVDYTKKESVDKAVDTTLAIMVGVQRIDANGKPKNADTIKQETEERLKNTGVDPAGIEAIREFIKIRLALGLTEQLKLEELQQGKLAAYIEELEKKEKEAVDLALEKGAHDRDFGPYKVKGTRDDLKDKMKAEKERRQAEIEKNSKLIAPGVYMQMGSSGAPFFNLSDNVGPGGIQEVVKQFKNKQVIFWHNLSEKNKKIAEKACALDWKKAVFKDGDKAEQRPLSKTMPRRPGDWAGWIRNINEQYGYSLFKASRCKDRLIKEIIGDDHPQKLKELWQDIVRQNNPALLKDVSKRLTNKQRKFLRESLGKEHEELLQQKEVLEKKIPPKIVKLQQERNEFQNSLNERKKTPKYVAYKALKDELKKLNLQLEEAKKLKTESENLQKLKEEQQKLQQSLGLEQGEQNPNPVPKTAFTQEEKIAAEKKLEEVNKQIESAENALKDKKIKTAEEIQKLESDIKAKEKEEADAIWDDALSPLRKKSPELLVVESEEATLAAKDKELQQALQQSGNVADIKQEMIALARCNQKIAALQGQLQGLGGEKSIQQQKIMVEAHDDETKTLEKAKAKQEQEKKEESVEPETTGVQQVAKPDEDKEEKKAEEKDKKDTEERERKRKEEEEKTKKETEEREKKRKQEEKAKKEEEEADDSDANGLSFHQ